MFRNMQRHMLRHIVLLCHWLQNCKLGHGRRLRCAFASPNPSAVVANSCTHRRRDETRQFRLVGVGGVYWALRYKHISWAPTRRQSSSVAQNGTEFELVDGNAFTPLVPHSILCSKIAASIFVHPTDFTAAATTAVISLSDWTWSCVTWRWWILLRRFCWDRSSRRSYRRGRRGKWWSCDPPDNSTQNWQQNLPTAN